MPLVLAPAGEENIIRRVGGSAEVKKHLEDLGFSVGSTVTIISEANGNIIVNVKDTRIAINKELAQKVMI